MDTPKKPQASEEGEAPAPPATDPSPSLPARSPFRPRSLRRRLAQIPDSPPAVERPSTSLVFDASPATVAAALAKAGASPDESSLVWRAGPTLTTAESDPQVEDDDSFALIRPGCRGQIARPGLRVRRSGSIGVL